MNEKSTETNSILQSFSDAVVALGENAGRSVVSVSAGDGSRRFGVGTGIVWNDEGYIVTNSHVIHRSEAAQIGLPSGDTTEASVVGRDRDSDIALLKIQGAVPSGLVPIKLGDSEHLRVGQFVLAIANAFVGQPSVTAGVITSTRRGIRAWGGQTFDNVVVSDAQVNPGYSGGPLVDASGKMIALNTAYAFNRALSIPVNTVKQVAESLRADGRVKHAFLGVTLDEVYLPEGVPELESQDSGLMILSVSNGSPAKSAGLALGDVVVGFDGKAVSSYGDLRKLLSANAIGKKTILSVLRGGKLNEFNVTPADDQAA